MKTFIYIVIFVTFTQAWKDNALVRISQSLATSGNLTKCWICYPNPRTTREHNSLLVQPVLNFSLIPECIVNQTHHSYVGYNPIISYPVRLAHSSQPLPCFYIYTRILPPKFTHKTIEEAEAAIIKLLEKYHQGSLKGEGPDLPGCATTDPWLNNLREQIRQNFEKFVCAPPGFIFVCGGDHHPWARRCIKGWIMRGQCLLGYLFTPVSIFDAEETQHWSSSLKPPSGFKQATLDGSSIYSFGRAFLAQWEVTNREQMIRNLSVTLGKLAEENAASIIAQQKAIDFSPNLKLDSRIALDYILAEKRGICMAMNASCCVYINMSHEVETHLETIRKEATWIK
ncbi:endogenous retrovirus group V member 2 Env polyprotein-like [Marmota monax]|uniref:endogenous retrovirus group V member 2 Env polyprotein-like n=1 Tax=Marmota monax TaxID=9995 RepID=UPI001EB02B3F|nr:endogenous retrovirus group V member 2 Env polyprotein-like [Marmota monax]XP_046313046.1 endogenous retrovirus group V member 2 Env polyprotein-like [Marmota monax]XP_046313047.1 endogenous retrovirus group V member 2 Env polyprotein-like [Marmota monax]